MPPMIRCMAKSVQQNGVYVIGTVVYHVCMHIHHTCVCVHACGSDMTMTIIASEIIAYISDIVIIINTIISPLNIL